MKNSHHDLILLHGSEQPDCHAVVDKDFSDYFTLQLITSGTLELEYGERQILLTAPAVFTCYPGPRIRFRLADSSTHHWHHHYLAFRGARVHDWISSGLFFFGEQKLDHSEPFGEAMRETLFILKESQPWARERVVARLESILADLALLRQARKPEPWLQDCLDELRPDQAPDYARLSKVCHLSLSHLRRKFKESMGLSLHDYWVEIRIREAGRLMANGEKNMASIADALGYGDVSYFSRQFRQKMGVSPKLYRQSLFTN